MSFNLVPASARRIVFVQFGDYAEAVRRFAAGDPETYYAQRHTVEYVGELAKRYGQVSVVMTTRDDVEELLPNGVRTFGVQLYPSGQRARHAELIRRVAALDPTDLIVRSPLRPLIRWGIRRGVRVFPIFADSFQTSGWRARFRNYLIRRLLNHSRIRWVANHSIAASTNLASIGVSPEKILPYDWPAFVSPADYGAKDGPTNPSFRLLYVGILSEAKGAGDAIRALCHLPEGPDGVSLTLVGKGLEENDLRGMTDRLGLSERVAFRGRIAHAKVLEEMRAHDAMIVPSRHSYPEGLPFTIYEALCTGTPVIASDHPMFLRRIRSDQNAIVFPAGDPAALAQAVGRLRSDPSLYGRLSRAGIDSAKDFLVPLKWRDLMERWLEGGADSDAYLATFSLGNRTYD